MDCAGAFYRQINSTQVTHNNIIIILRVSVWVSVLLPQKFVICSPKRDIYLNIFAKYSHPSQVLPIFANGWLRIMWYNIAKAVISRQNLFYGPDVQSM